MPGVLATVVGAVACLRLAAWQWERGGSSGALLHYTYAVEWTLLAVVLVGSAVGARRRGSRPQHERPPQDVRGRLLGPPLQPGEELVAPLGTRVRRRLTGRPAAVAQMEGDGS